LKRRAHKFSLLQRWLSSCAGVLLSLLAQVNAASSQSPADGAADSLPAFEVISIRGHKPGYWPASGPPPSFTADAFTWINAQPQAIITEAYDLRDPKLQIAIIPGAPKWIRNDWYDIRARLSEYDRDKISRMDSNERAAYRRQLLQSLLIDRFKLACHLTFKEALAYELVVIKGGPKNMKIAALGSPEGINAIDNGDLQYYGSTLEPLLMILPQMLQDRPVIDKTGLAGRYNFELKWARDADAWRSTGPGGLPLAPADGSRPSIFKALEEELGLKLVPIRATQKSIVIDHIERPSPN